MIFSLAILIGVLVGPAWAVARETQIDRFVDTDLDLPNAKKHKIRSMKTGFLQAERLIPDQMTEPGELARVMVGDGEKDLLEAYHKDKFLGNIAGNIAGNDAIIKPQAPEHSRAMRAKNSRASRAKLASRAVGHLEKLLKFHVNPPTEFPGPPAKPLDIPGAGRQEVAELIKQDMDKPVKLQRAAVPLTETEPDDAADSILPKHLDRETDANEWSKKSPKQNMDKPVKLQRATVPHTDTKPDDAAASILAKHLDRETDANEWSKKSLKGMTSVADEQEDKDAEKEYDKMMSEQENLEEQEEDVKLVSRAERVDTSMDAGESREVLAEKNGKQEKMRSQDEVDKLQDKLHENTDEVAREIATAEPSMRENTWDALDSESSELLTESAKKNMSLNELAKSPVLAEHTKKNMSLKELAKPPGHTLEDDELLSNMTVDKEGILWVITEGDQTPADNDRLSNMPVDKKRIKQADTAATKPLSDPAPLPARNRPDENTGSSTDFSGDFKKHIDKELGNMTSEFSRLRDELFAGKPATSLEPTKYQEKLEHYRSDFVREIAASRSKQSNGTTHPDKSTGQRSENSRGRTRGEELERYGEELMGKTSTDRVKGRNSSNVKSKEEPTRLEDKALKEPPPKVVDTSASDLSYQNKEAADANESNEQLSRYDEEKMSVKTSGDDQVSKRHDTTKVLSADFYEAVGVPVGHSPQQRDVATESSGKSGRVDDNNVASEDRLTKLESANTTGDEGVLLRTVRQLQNKSASKANKTHERLFVAARRTTDPINETGQYACLIQGKNKSWAKGDAPATWDLDKWQCMDMPQTSDNTISSFHTVTGSSCRVQFYGGSNCRNGKPLFETKKASLDKFRYTSGTNLANTGFNNQISSVRCSCTVEVVYMYQGFLRIPGSDCEGHLPGTKFFATKRFKKSRSDSAIACRISCKMYGDKCLGFKMWRVGGSKASAAREYECGFADAFWFKSQHALTDETYFAVDSEEQEVAPACFIRTFGPR